MMKYTPKAKRPRTFRNPVLQGEIVPPENAGKPLVTPLKVFYLEAGEVAGMPEWLSQPYVSCYDSETVRKIEALMKLAYSDGSGNISKNSWDELTRMDERGNIRIEYQLIKNEQ